MALIRFTNRPALSSRSFLDELPERMRQMFEGTLTQVNDQLMVNA